MNNCTQKATIKTLGIDLAKSSFHMYGVDKIGNKVLSKKVTKSQLKQYLINLPPCLIAMEACGSSHYWATVPANP